MFHYARTKGKLMKKKKNPMYVKLMKGLLKPNSTTKFTDTINVSHRFQERWTTSLNKKISRFTLHGITKSLETNKQTDRQTKKNLLVMCFSTLTGPLGHAFSKSPVWNSGLFSLTTEHSWRVTIKEAILDYTTNLLCSEFTSLHLHVAKQIRLCKLRHQHTVF